MAEHTSHPSSTTPATPATPVAQTATPFLHQHEHVRDEKRCVSCGHTEESHKKPIPPPPVPCQVGGCVCLNYVEGTAGSVEAVKKEEAFQREFLKKQEEARRSEA